MLYRLLLIGSFLLSLNASDITTTTDGGERRKIDDLALLLTHGDGTNMGRQSAELYGKETQALVTALNFHPRLQRESGHDQLETLKEKIPVAYRDELHALSQHAKIDENTLIRLNLAVDVLCTVAIRLPSKEQPLRIARNMDFPPAQLLGPMTLVHIRRSPGNRTVCSIGWPGYIGVLSGMNDAGLSVFLLLNHNAIADENGAPTGLLLRTILEQAGDVTAAIKQFAAQPVSSANYVVFADEKQAAIVWHDKDGFHRVDPTDQHILCTNGAIGEDKRPTDLRGQRLQQFLEQESVFDVNTCQQLLAATYMKRINAQAMVFTPQQRQFVLALADTTKPASLNHWHSINLQSVFHGKSLAEINYRKLPAITPRLPHYSEP
jgi:isopenicillin-N N-acyltransferase like protein